MPLDLERLTDLGLFARVVESRSFSEAARRSGVAKSAVSRRISLLERRLGVQLLRRTTRRLDVTPEGARFYEHCAQLLASARAAEEAVAGAETAVRGLVRVSAPVTFAQTHLPTALAAFARAHSEIELVLSADDRLVDVFDGGFDLVVRVSRLKDASFVARRLATDRLVVVGSPTYLDGLGRPHTPEELVHHNCLHYELVPRADEWRFRGADGRPLAMVRGNFSASNGTILKEMAIQGLGLAVLPLFMVADELAAGRLECVLEGRRKAEIGIYALVSSSKGLPLRVRALLHHLVRWFGHDDWRTSRHSAKS